MLVQQRIYILAESQQTWFAVSGQRSRCCGVTTSGGPKPRWAVVAQGGVALRMDISIIFMVCFADNPSTCSLDRDSREMPSARSTVAVVASRRRGDCRHGGERSIRVSHPSYAYSRKELMCLHFWCNGTYTIVFVECLVHSAATVYARWFATAVTCRQRAAPSPLWRYKGGVAIATVGGGRSKGESPYPFISIIFMVRLTYTECFNLLASDDNHVSVTATPAASSTVTVVDSHRREDRRYSGRLSLKGESPYACRSASSSWYSWPMTRLHAR